MFYLGEAYLLYMKVSMNIFVAQVPVTDSVPQESSARLGSTLTDGGTKSCPERFLPLALLCSAQHQLGYF